jgi:hypothetical protein
MRKHLLNVGLVLLNLAATAGCAADPSTVDDVGSPPEGSVKLTPAEVANLRAEGANLPEGTNIYVLPTARVSQPPDEKLTPSVVKDFCERTDTWEHAPVAEPILLCTLPPNSICTPSTITLLEHVECTSSAAKLVCPTPTNCLALSALTRQTHSTTRPTSTPDEACNDVCRHTTGECTTTCRP